MATPEGPPRIMAHDGLVHALVQVSFVTMAVLSKVGADHDLSLTQLRVLGILRDRRVRMTRLADYLGLEKSTMTGLVDRAVKRGLLERGRTPTTAAPWTCSSAPPGQRWPNASTTRSGGHCPR